MNLREQLLKTIRFENPGGILGWLWWDGEAEKYHAPVEILRTETALARAWRGHAIPISAPQPAGPNRLRDAWNCVWQTEISGITGQVIENPIASYSALDTYRAPVDLLSITPSQFEQIQAAISASPDVLHKIGWMQLYERMRYLRPAQELYIDIAEDSRNLYRLRDTVMEYLQRELDLYLSLDVDVITFSEDWGTQVSLQISPRSWRKVFKPAYRALFDRIHAAGKMVEFHSCGFIRDIIEDLIELQVEIVHLQVGCMNLAELAARFKGRICFEADFDRQRMPVETPEWVRSEVGRIASCLGSPEGGLFIVAEVAGAAPLENVDAFITAMWELNPNQG